MSEIRIVGLEPKQEKELTYLQDIKPGTVFVDKWKTNRPRLYMKTAGRVIDLEDPFNYYIGENTIFEVDREVDIEIKIL